MNIRKATPADAAEICSVHIASILGLCDRSYSKEQIDAWIEPLVPGLYLPAMEKFTFFVAEQDHILGFSMLDVEGAELNAIYLHPDAVGRGIGRRLLELAEQLARQRSVKILRLKATLNAVGFYQACGFRQVGTNVHRTPSGLELDCVEMEKRLN